MADHGLSALAPRVCAGLADDPAAAGPLGLWLLDRASVPEEDVTLAWSWLDGDERSRAAAYARPGLSRDHTVAHGLLRRVLGSVLDLPPERVRLSRQACLGCGGPHGRPVTDGVWFSLSHTDDLVLVAVADRPVGCDVERHPDGPEEALRLAGLLHPDELAEVAEVAARHPDPLESAVWFTRAWVRTEAHLKALGTGLLRDPSLDLLGAGPRPVRHLGGRTVSDVRVPPGHEAAVCVEEPAPA